MIIILMYHARSEVFMTMNIKITACDTVENKGGGGVLQNVDTTRLHGFTSQMH
jgi:hypothetical protein